MANPEAAASTAELAAGRCVQIPDVLAQPAWSSPARRGALLITVRDGASCGLTCGIAVLSRTWNSNAVTPRPVDESLPAMAARNGLRRGGWVEVDGVTDGPARRASIGMAAWSAEAMTVRIVVRSSAGTEVARKSETVPAWGQRQVRLPVAVEGGTVRVEVTTAPSHGLLFAFVSEVENATGLPTHRLPDRLGGPSGPGTSLPPLPRALGTR